MRWVDWSLAAQHRDLVDFVSRLCELRRSRLWLRRDTFLKGSSRAGRTKDVSWLHPQGREMHDGDWNDTAQQCIGVHLGAASVARETAGHDVLAVFNASARPVEFRLPAAARHDAWRILLDTAEFAPPDTPRIVRGAEVLTVESRSAVLLESWSDTAQPPDTSGDATSQGV